MKINNEQVKRLGIYFFYEKEGIVDSYVKYFFKDYVKQVTDMIVVCNGQLNEEGHKFFEQYTKSVIVRENKGLDVWAYKTAMESLGWEKLVQYDEICFVNCTIMGPVYTLKETFEAMSKENLDFWGMTKHYKNEYDPFHNNRYGYLPEHIQSHFMVFRQSLVKSEDFQSFWDEMPMIKGYEDSIGNFESIFTKHFADKGYKWDVYSDTRDCMDYTDLPIISMPVKLIRDKKCPIFKRRNFFQEYFDIMNKSTGEIERELYEYLINNTDYDVNLIWDNMLRVQNIADIKKAVQLNYVLSSKALENNEFTVYLQPKVDINSEIPVGCEALVRWISPEKGFIAPGDFIPLFEKNGFVTEVDFFVLEQVCRMLRRRMDEGLPVFPVNVNQSRLHVNDRMYLSMLQDMLNKYNIPMNMVVFEITESAFIEDSKTMVGLINKMKALGFSFSMDDFGSGYSSFNLLKDMAVDELKIDKEFLESTDDSKRSRYIIEKIVQMAHGLDIRVVCEGVERKEQVEFLREIECDIIQGYYYSKPMPMADYEKYLLQFDLKQA